MLAPLAEVYVQRNFLAAVSRRLVPWLVVLAGCLAAAPAYAVDVKAEREAQALQKKAIEEDNLNVNYPAAIKKLQTAIGKCSGDRCNPQLRAALFRDLGAMQVLNGNAEDARSSFAQAIALDPSIDLDPAYKNPQIEQVWNDVKKKGGGAPTTEPPAGGGAPPVAQPTGDFAHTPAPEALVRTPLPVYAEYAGSEQIARVILKYKGPGMADWKPLDLPKLGSGWGALIPCKDVGPGAIQYYIQGFNAANDPVATSGSRNKPFTVPVKQQIAGAPPGLPGQEPPKQCSETSGPGVECPPDFPGCNNKKSPGEECKKDSECASSSCVEGKCADKKAGGEKCESDDECASGSCADGTCTAAKKAEGEDCSSDDECEAGACKEGKCGGGGGGKYSKLWVGVAASMDFFLMPGTTDVCRLNMGGTAPATAGNPYSCVDPSTGANFPSDAASNGAIAQHGDLVQSGFAPGNLRLMISIDYAVTPNILLGVRGGYELFTDPAPAPGAAFAPVHGEARLTYLFGKDGIAQKVAPMVLLAAGVGEFDAYVQVPVFLTQGAGVPPKQQPENAWLTAGPGFAAAGGGVRILLSKKAALTGAVKLEAAFGGSASLLFGAAPELGIQLGF